MSSRHAAAGRKPISSVSSREAHFLKKALQEMIDWLIRRKRRTQVAPIECHELWEYLTPKRRDAASDTRGVQTLVALLSLCKACHRMFHPGRAEAHSQSDEVWERIAWANRWTGEQAAAYSRVVHKIWQRRSAISWDLDLRLVRNWELVVRRRRSICAMTAVSKMSNRIASPASWTSTGASPKRTNFKKRCLFRTG